MELKKSQPVIEVNQSPIGVYIGSDIIEGYARLHPEEMEMPPKRREANEHAVYMANKAAIDKAIALSKVISPPVHEGGKVALSIRLSPPKYDKPYTQVTPIALLPNEAASLAKGVKEGDPFVIIAVSVMWTARWICLPDGGIEGLPKDSVTASSAKTHIGDKVFDFGCPQPMFDKVIVKESNHVHRELKRYTQEDFRRDYVRFKSEMERSLEQEVMMQLHNALRQLPKCPAECPETQMSITLGYPETFSITTEETVTVQYKREYVYTPKIEAVDVPYDVLTYHVIGKWSWAVQRACCSD